jgi:hypothetical protein
MNSDPATMTQSLYQLKETVMDKLRNVSGTVMLYGAYLIIIVVMIIYYLYVSRLPKTECDKFNDLYSTINSNISPLNSNDPNCKYLLRDYYIKSAYNCCSGGSYKNDYVSLCILKNILLQGVRGLDFELYSINDRPVVATSSSDSYHIKETFNYIDFAEVMQTLVSDAFSSSSCPNPTDPLIIHLRIKSANQKMYTNLAKIFKTNEHLMLGKEYSYENERYNLGETKILSLSSKIILIIDKSNAAFMDCVDLYEFVNMTSNSVFMRALNYYDIQYSPDLSELIEYNQRCMTIAMPDKGNDPPNPSGILVRETGTQMIAMRYQQFDANLEESELFFSQAGYAFALKPEQFRYNSVKISKPIQPKPGLSYAPRKIETNFYSFTI